MLMMRDHQNVPAGYVPIAISEELASAAIKVCVLVKAEPDRVGGRLILLREMLNARVYLGCLLDTAGRVHDRLEIRVQNAESLLGAPNEHPNLFCNAMLDDRWQREVAALGRLDNGGLVAGGWETVNPLPTFLDIGSRSPVHPKDPETGTPWELCRDEGLLQQKELPGYSGSLHRYLYLPALGDQSPLVPVTCQAPTNGHTRDLADILGQAQPLVDFNPQAGMIQVRKHLPFAFEAFVDALGGAPLEGVRHGRTLVPLGQERDADATAALEPAFADGFLLGSSGARGRLLETFYLKLTLLLDATRSVSSMVRDLQQPLLNISHESFRIHLAGSGSALPRYWTAGAELVVPGHAVGFDVEKGQARYYVSACEERTSVYHPARVSTHQKGQGQVRIRKVLVESDDSVSLEGTFACQERLDVTSSDLVRLRLNLASGGLDVYARLEVDSALTAGEWRFRTVARQAGAAGVASWRSAEGLRLLDVPYEAIPLLSTPCDLYSLAVLFIRTLLVNRSTSLPMAVDEVFSLAQEVRSGCSSGGELAAQIETLLTSNDKWRKSLGPQRLRLEEMSAEAALGAIPVKLWWATLAMIVRMFPGLGAMSDCRDHGAAVQGGLHRVFEPTVARLEELVRRTHRLILPDPTADGMIAGVVRRRLEQLKTRAAR